MTTPCLGRAAHRLSASSALLRVSALAFLLTAGSVLAGCAAYPRVPCPPQVTPALGEMREHYAVIDVLFATDRRPTGSAEPALKFGVERQRSLSYGHCQVSIPATHQLGGQEEPALLGRPDPARSVLLMSVDITDQPKRGDQPANFIAELRERVARSPRKEILVFVHGFAANFDDAARDTAQLAHDLHFDGVPLCYSWPTQGLLLGYLVDGANAEWTVPYFVSLLDTLVRESGAERIHLMAHSMGTRVLARGVRAYAVRQGRRALRGASASAPSTAPLSPDRSPPTTLTNPTSQPLGTLTPLREQSSRGLNAQMPFDQVILAAADLDAEIFERDFVPALLEVARRTTIYMSSKDVALGLSLRLNGYARLGQTDLPNVDLDALRRIDVVNVTDFDRDFVGHFYHTRCPRVLADLSAVLQTAAGPKDLDPSTETAPESDKSARRLQRTFYYRMQP